MSQFDFAILGAGGMGSILGAHLAHEGHRVALLARGHRACQIERDGLHIRGLRDLSTRAAHVLEPAQLRHADVLIVAIKAIGTREALRALGHCDIGAAFSIQNGVLKNELLADALGPGRVLGAVADTSGELLPGGEVHFTRNVGIAVGELSGEDSLRASRVAKVLGGAGIEASSTQNIVSREWSKFACWIALMCLSVTTRTETWRFLADPDGALLLIRLVQEMTLVMRSVGVEPTDQSTLPVASIGRGSESDALALVLKIAAEFRGSSPDHRMSSLQDLDLGRPLELDETLGHALKTAHRFQLSVPNLAVCRHLVQAANRIAQERMRAAVGAT